MYALFTGTKPSFESDSGLGITVWVAVARLVTLLWYSLSATGTAIGQVTYTVVNPTVRPGRVVTTVSIATRTTVTVSVASVGAALTPEEVAPEP